MQIKRIAIYLPQDIVTNEDLKKQCPNRNYNKIEEKVGI